MQQASYAPCPELCPAIRPAPAAAEAAAAAAPPADAHWQVPWECSILRMPSCRPQSRMEVRMSARAGARSEEAGRGPGSRMGMLTRAAAAIAARGLHAGPSTQTTHAAQPGPSHRSAPITPACGTSHHICHKVQMRRAPCTKLPCIGTMFFWNIKLD